MKRALLKLLVILVAAVCVVSLWAAWGIHRWEELFSTWAYFWGSLANLFSLTAFPLLFVLLLAGSRFALVEQLFGLERLLRLHKKLAVVVVGLLVAHALLRTLNTSLLSAETWWEWSFLFSMETGTPEQWALVIARLSLGALLLAAALAKLGEYVLPFSVWKPPHFLLYAVIIGGLAHSWLIGTEIKQPPYILIWFFLALLFLAAVFFRFRYLLSRNRRFAWTLNEVQPETHDTSTLWLSPLEGFPVTFALRKPGQFGFLRFKRSVGWSEPHPFTISCSPESKRLSVTVKRTGEFTSTLHGLEPQSVLLYEGPYGVFTPNFKKEKNLVLIAGGIGVTPFLSIIRHVRDQRLDCKITLIWGNKTRKDIIAGEELEELAKEGWLQLVHVLSQEEEETGLQKEARPRETTSEEPSLEDSPAVYEYGYVTGKLLKRHVQRKKASYYLCGPPVMQEFVLEEIDRFLKVGRGRVKRELFSW